MCHYDGHERNASSWNALRRELSNFIQKVRFEPVWQDAFRACQEAQENETEYCDDEEGVKTANGGMGPPPDCGASANVSKAAASSHASPISKSVDAGDAFPHAAAASQTEIPSSVRQTLHADAGKQAETESNLKFKAASSSEAAASSHAVAASHSKEPASSPEISTMIVELDAPKMSGSLSFPLWLQAQTEEKQATATSSYWRLRAAQEQWRLEKPKVNPKVEKPVKRY